MRLRELYEDVEGEFDVLYHGTWKNRLDDIMRHGLDPSRSKWVEDERGFGPPPHHYVYLSSLRGARDFSPGGSAYPEIGPGSDPNNATILRIQLPPELQAKLVTDRGEFVRAPFVIPPQYIDVVEA